MTARGVGTHSRTLGLLSARRNVGQGLCPRGSLLRPGGTSCSTSASRSAPISALRTGRRGLADGGFTWHGLSRRRKRLRCSSRSRLSSFAALFDYTCASDPCVEHISAHVPACLSCFVLVEGQQNLFAASLSSQEMDKQTVAIELLDKEFGAVATPVFIRSQYCYLLRGGTLTRSYASSLF